MKLRSQFSNINTRLVAEKVRRPGISQSFHCTQSISFVRISPSVPKTSLTELARALGFQDIDFDDHPEFSSKFVLQGSSEPQIREYFNQETLDFFTARPDICVEAQSGTLFYYRVNKRINPKQVKDNLGEAYEIFGMMVDHE